VEGEAELKSSGALELAEQAVCSFFPLKKEHFPGAAAAICCDTYCLLGLALEAVLPDRQSVFGGATALGTSLLQVFL
jgi:hypothetical protein